MNFYPIRYHWIDRMGSSYTATSVASGKTPDDARRRFLRDHPDVRHAEIVTRRPPATCNLQPETPAVP